MSYQRMQKSVINGLKRAAVRTGGKVLIGKIIKGSTGGAPSAWGGTGTQNDDGSGNATILFDKFSSQDVDGTNIRMDDLKVLIAPDAEVTPENDDVLEVDGVKYSIGMINAVMPGNQPLLWEARARAGG